MVSEKPIKKTQAHKKSNTNVDKMPQNTQKAMTKSAKTANITMHNCVHNAAQVLAHFIA